MALYYLKKCGFQELGSVGLDGKTHRGRYLLTSMSPNILSIFPALSTTKKNDFSLLPIIPLYTGKKVYCTFVYHNDKFHGSQAKHPRNEYRIYLNNELENTPKYFVHNDIMIIRKEVVEDNGELQTIYPMDLVKDKNSILYKYLDGLISNSKILGGYAVYEGIISEFENKYDEIKKAGDPVITIDDSVTSFVEKSESETVANLFNSTNFRDFVMVGYENLCAVTRTVIKYENYMNLEAAHIKPKSHGGLFLPNNGIAMSRDIHWAFDKGFFSLSNDYNIIVHPKTTSEYLHSFAGKQIKLPSNNFFVPEIANIQYHRENVYGLFLTTGRL